MKLIILAIAFGFASCYYSQVTSYPLQAPADRPDIRVADQREVQSGNEWIPASFMGLTVGKSFEKDMLKLLRKPARTDEPGDNDLPAGVPNNEVDHTYMDIKGFKGQVVFHVSKKTKVINGVSYYPENLYLDEAISTYGNQYKTSRYKVLECPGDAGSSLIQEATDGPIEYVEYRTVGIAIDVDTSEKKVRSIEFVSGPISHSNCE